MADPAQPPPFKTMARSAIPKSRSKPAAPKRPAVMTGAIVPVLGWPPDEDRVEAVFERLSRIMPDPKTELNFSLSLIHI